MYEPNRHGQPCSPRVLRSLLLLCLCVPAGLLLSLAARGATEALEPRIAGHWVVNEQLSDDTDRQVEKALRAAGQKVERRLFDRRKDRYRGGPEEHELYDRISYDDRLEIELQAPEYRFTYADDYSRSVYTNGRRRSVSLSNVGEVSDFSMAHWDGEILKVEGRVRDGGFTQESYRLTEEGRLRAELFIRPRSFSEPIELVRVYDRRADAEDRSHD